TVLDTKGDLNQEAKSVIDAMLGSDIILGTGHLSLTETKKVIDYSRRAGTEKILVTHPEFRATLFSREEQMKLAENGAYIEHCATVDYDPKLIAENIKF